VAHNNLGLIYRRRGELELAEKHYKRALEEDPHLDAAYINLAQLYAQQGKKEESFAQFGKAVEVNRANPHPVALANLGVYHFNRGLAQYDEVAVRKKELALARAYYRRALSRDQDYAMVHHYLSDLYSLADFNRPDLAAFHLRRTLELDPKQPDAAQLRESLKAAEVAAAERAAKSQDGKAPDSDAPHEDGSTQPAPADSDSAQQTSNGDPPPAQP
jgi:tetratricopeptide (TPR) repeat protein